MAGTGDTGGLGEGFDAIVKAAYEQVVDDYLNSPLMNMWREESERYWADKSRWFKFRHRVKYRAGDRVWAIRMRIAEWFAGQSWPDY